MSHFISNCSSIHIKKSQSAAASRTWHCLSYIEWPYY